MSGKRPFDTQIIKLCTNERSDKMSTVYFVTNNIKKFEETEDALELIQKTIPEEERWILKHEKIDIAEKQTMDSQELVREKALAAFKKLKRPVLVEQTSLKIKAMGNLPGLQSSYFFNAGDRSSKDEIFEDIVLFCREKKNYSASAETNYCLCDGKTFSYGRSCVNGEITEVYKANPDAFGWDAIFKPEAKNATYAEDKAYKIENSMRKNALKDLHMKCSGHKLFIDENEADNQKVIDELRKLIEKKQVMLFIGAGISAGLSKDKGLPPWSQLMGELGEKADFDKKIFQTYGDNMMLAEYLMQQKRTDIVKHLKERFQIDKGSEIYDRYLKNSEIYELIMDLDVPVIYTTNFDNLLESYCDIVGKKYSVCKEISDVQQQNKDALRIMKFHGDITQFSEFQEDDPEDVVLTESQYYDRMRFDAFMDIQLQADLQRYHVLFLGYSLSDINVKMLMYLSRNRWKRKGNGDKMPNAYIFTATPNIIQKEVFKENGIISISNGFTDKYEATIEFLKGLSRKKKKAPRSK